MRKKILKYIVCATALTLFGGMSIALNSHATVAEEQSYTITNNFNLNEADDAYLEKYAITGDAANYPSYEYFSNGEPIDFSSGCLLDIPAGSAKCDIPLANAYYGSFSMIMQPVMQNAYKVDNWKSWGYESPDYKQLEVRFDDLYSDDYITVRFTGNVDGYTVVKLIYETNGLETESNINTTATSLINVNMFGAAHYIDTLRNVPLRMKFDPSNPKTIFLTHNKDSRFQEITVVNNDLPVFENYAVTLSVAERSLSASSKLMLYEVGGQRLNGSSITDTSVPVICYDSVDKLNAPIKAVKGYSYTLAKTYAFDMLKGDLTHQVKTVVKAPDETVCDITNGKFRVEQAGIYTITHTVDDGVHSTERVLYLEALEKIPAYEMNGTFVLGTEYERMSTVYLPKLTIKTGLSIRDNPLKYFVFVQKDYKTLYRFEQEEAISFIPEEVGTYDIIYVAENEIGLRIAHTYSFESVDKPYFADVTLDKYIHCGAEYVFPKLPLIYNGVEYTSTVTEIKGPNVNLNGEYAKFTPKEYGEYTFTYTAKYNETVYQKEVSVRCSAVPSALFREDSGIVSIQGNQDMPKYSQDGNGVMILGAKNYSSFYYNYLIDFNQLTKEQNLIKFQVLHGENYATFDTLIIELIDEKDSNNVLKIKMQQSDEGLWSYMNVNYDGRDMGLWANNNTGIPKLYGKGSLFHSTFNGSNYTNCGLFGVQFDYQNKRIYADHFRATGNNGLVLDASDETIVGEGKTWKGFSTGRAYMKITISTLNSTGGIIVEEVAGISLSGNECASAEPKIYFEDNPKADYTNMPVALVNAAYHIPKAQGYDRVFGESKLLVEIYPQQTILEKVEFVYADGAEYTFTEVGTYSIRYTATNWEGKQWVHELTVSVENELPTLDVELSEEVESVDIGSKFKLPVMHAIGGSGIAQVDYSVYYGNTLLECTEIIEIDRVEDIRFVYTVIDYLGNSKSGEISIKVVPNAMGAPIVNVLDTLPLSAKIGENIKLPEFTAIDYNYPVGSGQYTPERWVEINGVKNKDLNNFIVDGNVGDTVHVAFCAGGTRIERNIRIIRGAYLADYLLAEKQSTVLETGQFEVSATMVEDDTILIANRVSENEVGISFSITPEKNGMENVKVIFRDGLEQGKSVTLTFLPNDSKTSYMRKSNSDKLYVIDGSFENAQIGFSFVFNVKTKTLKTIDGRIITTIEQMDNGTNFDGFYQGGVEVSFAVCRVDPEKGAQLNIQQVSNQQFSSRFYNGEIAVYSDRTSPVISYFGDVPEGQYHIDNQVTLPAAIAYDVLNGKCEVFVKVTAPNGKVVLDRLSADTPRVFALSFYGKYTIEYITKDGGGREYITPYVISVVDEVPPTLTINGALQDTYTLGSTVSLPSATATDNVSNVVVYVTVISPDRKMTVKNHGDSYTFSEKGTYRIYYRVVDEAGNYVAELLTVTVN